jgi:hypothetical protein
MKLPNGKKAVLVLVPVISTFLAIYGGRVIAGDDIACAIYGKTAVAQQEQNLKHSCGYSGPEWNSDYKYHNGWCVNADQSLADAGTAKRVSMLMKCKGVQFPAGADKWCNIYSIIATAQNTANIATKCGLSGPEWNSSYEYHYNWCVKAPKSSSVSGMNQRRESLMKCAE